MTQTVENPPAMQETRDVVLIPESGKSPGEGNGNPLQYSCQRNPTPGGLQSMGLQKVRHGGGKHVSIYIFTKKEIIDLFIQKQIVCVCVCVFV